MAAAQQQLDRLNDYLENTIGITSQALRDALNAEGIISFASFALLDDDDMTRICTVIRRPGGTIPNPANAVLILPNPAVPVNIPNPGVPVGYVYEKRLKLFRFFVFHNDRVQRLRFDPATVSLDVLNDYGELQRTLADADDDDIKMPEPLTKIENVRSTLEDLEDYLRRKRGSNAAPLLHVVRAHVELPEDMVPAEVDPDPGLPNFDDEMIRRFAHTGNF
jgi:hypothetical protein